jgi:hypothetical protein
MEDGRWKMGDGRWEMEDGRWKMGKRALHDRPESRSDGLG